MTGGFKAGGVLGAILLGAGMCSLAAAAVSASSVSLKASDLPSAYKLYNTRTVSNAQMAKSTKVPKAEFEAHGRITGVEEEFRQSSTTTMPTNIFSNVYQYKTAGGAAWDYSQSVAHDMKASKSVSVPSIGVATHGFSQTGSTGGKSFTLYGVDFHRGAFDVTVGVGGLTGTVTMKDAIKYARLVDQRIQGG